MSGIIYLWKVSPQAVEPGEPFVALKYVSAIAEARPGVSMELDM